MHIYIELNLTPFTSCRQTKESLILLRSAKRLYILTGLYSLLGLIIIFCCILTSTLKH